MSTSHPHEWFIENRSAFVVLALKPDEAAVFSAHLVRCPECATAVADLERELRWLPLGARPAVVSSATRTAFARAAIGPSARSGHGARGPWRWLVGVVAASLLLIAAGAIGAGTQRERTARLAAAVDAKASEIAMLRDTISVMRQANRVLTASVAVDGNVGGLLIFADEGSHRWNVVMHGVPPAPAGQTYQFWFITSDGMVRSVTLEAQGTRPSFTTLEMPPTGGTVMGASLTLEPMDRPTTSPRGKELVHLML